MIISKLKNIEADIKNINNDLEKIISDDKHNIKTMNEKLDKILFLLETSKKRINNKTQSHTGPDNFIIEGYSFFD